MSFVDKKTIYEHYTSFRKKLSELFYKFSLFERVVVIIFGLILATSSFITLVQLNDSFVTEVPKDGGEFIEGLVGAPRFINPILAISDIDRDITQLVYSGLLRINTEGELITDLAEEYSVSEDGLNYYFKIKDSAVFHDGTNVTTDDIMFTISRIQDPSVKSPRRPNWDGVRIEKINEKELVFNLPAPYAPFIFNTTIGILPQHKWQNISTEEFSFSVLNTNPIGSGPYEVRNIRRDTDEIITSYELQSFSKYTIKKPYINRIIINFYRTEDTLIEAFNKKQIQSIHSISPRSISELQIRNHSIITLPYSRVFALFFNQNRSNILAEQEVREALNASINRGSLIDSVLQGYATPLYGPLDLFSDQNTNQFDFSLENAKNILDGTSLEEETLVISTNNVPELIAVGEKITEYFGALGLNTELDIQDINELTSNTIRPREYQAILFGNVINRDLDYYAFWHSSQRNDPGLNLSLYTSIDSDRALEEARSIIDSDEKLELLQNFEKEVINDVPALFLYSPDFIYIVPQAISSQFPHIVVTSSDRFAEVYNWYIETEKVWKFFAQ